MFYVIKEFWKSVCPLNSYQRKVFFVGVETNLRGKKWLVSCSYNPHRDNINNHLQIISKNLELYFSQNDNIIVLEDFNTEAGNNSMKTFCARSNLSSLFKDLTCYKDFENPTCIDLSLTHYAVFKTLVY